MSRERGNEVAEGKTAVLHRLDNELIAWLDDEAKKRDRSRVWMLEESVRQWRRRLERERAARLARSQRKAARKG